MSANRSLPLGGRKGSVVHTRTHPTIAKVPPRSPATSVAALTTPPTVPAPAPAPAPAPGRAISLVRTEKREDDGTTYLVVDFPAGMKRDQDRIKRSLLADHRLFEREMLNLNCSASLDFKAELASLRSNKTAPTVTAVTSPRWVGSRFVNFRGEFGQPPEGGDTVLFDQSCDRYTGHETAGDLEAYLAGLNEPFMHSPALLLSYAAAFVPPLLLRMGETEGFTIALTGESSTGKTRCAWLAASVSTFGSAQGLVGLNMTKGVAGQFGSYGGSAVPLTDLKGSQDDFKVLMQVLKILIFSVADEITRQRLTERSSKRPSGCIPIVTAEDPIYVLFRSYGVDFQNGDGVRILEVSDFKCDTGGIFLTDPEESSRLVKVLESTIKANYGLVMDPWVTKLAGLSSEKLQGLQALYRSDFHSIVGTFEGLEDRNMDHLFWVYFAARLARKEFVGIDLKVVNSHFRWLSKRCLTSLNASNVSLKSDIAALLRALADPDDYPLVWAREAADPIACKLGFTRDDDGTRYVYAKKEPLDQLISPPNLANVYSVLRRDCGLIPGKVKLTWAIEQKGLGKSRYLKFRYDDLIDDGRAD